MKLSERVLKDLDLRRENVLSGNTNCIPSPFTRFREDYLGVEQGRYYLISAGPKSGKTQFANYTFVYSPLIYAYLHPGKIKLRIFYYPLEETKEEIIMRFMCFLLYELSSKEIRISPMDLKSSNEKKILPESILTTLNSEQYTEILDFFEECVIFKESTNPTGVWKDMLDYASKNGEVHYKEIDIVDKLTGEITKRKAFDYYKPEDPKEYVIILVDHISLISLERGMSLRESINKLSEYMVILKNKYNYSPVLIQQQSSETMSLDAYKSNKIKPTVNGLGDSKYTARDCSIFLGITNPYAHELPEYYKYDITKLKNHFRLLEVVINRFGNSTGTIGLYFDGAVNYFAELPRPDDLSAMQRVYTMVAQLTEKTNKLFFIFINKIKQKRKNGKNCCDFGFIRRWKNN